jgi:hypothetical protein
MKYRLRFLNQAIALCALSCLLLPARGFAQAIDRYALVNRHNVVLNEVDPLSPFSVGNGDFAYTADVTGMQSFEDYYYKNGISLETLSTWVWHSFPNTKNLTLAQASKAIDFHGRQIMYASEEKTEAGEYFRVNPHPVPLGQISLMQGDGKTLDMASLSHINQKLDMWKGLITSNYDINGTPVSVETTSHPDQSTVAFKIKSALLKSGALKPAFRFPYSYDFSKKNKPPFDWGHTDKHQTTVISQTANNVVLKRSIEGAVYYVTIHWVGKGKFVSDGPHRFMLDGSGSDSLQLVCAFSKTAPKQPIPLFTAVKAASIAGWKSYWTKGGEVDFSACKDPRAPELERRVILSQYLLKINYAGSFPPAETGLTHISWYGKHNSEVYWWHVAQFYIWGRTDLLEKSFAWYNKILPTAVAQAKSEGFEGARWPKMSGIDGRPSPGGINPFIIWNQCNPIYLAELIYRAKPNAATLKKYSGIVFESANFMASYAFFDTKTNRYILGPPIKSVNESQVANDTQNPTFELTQWYYGLKVAQDWRQRMGMPRNPKWDDILKKLARPTVRNGRYVQIETDGPGSGGSDMIMALGYLPQTEMIDKNIMATTFNAIYGNGSLRGFISWSLGKGAMTAARLGETDRAVNIVCNDTFGAKFLKNGHVQRAKEPLTCPAYLPANSAFMAAVGLMSGGWDDAPKGIIAPGFPKDGNWNVKVEGMNKLP